MTAATQADLAKRVQHHQVQLQQLERELSDARGRRDDDAEALRDVRQAVIALARAHRSLTQREALPFDPPTAAEVLGEVIA